MLVKCISGHDQPTGPGRFIRYVKGREYEKISGMIEKYFEPVKSKAKTDTSKKVKEG
jgi:hypothetical protein